VHLKNVPHVFEKKFCIPFHSLVLLCVLFGCADDIHMYICT